MQELLCRAQILLNWTQFVTGAAAPSLSLSRDRSVLKFLQIHSQIMIKRFSNGAKPMAVVVIESVALFARVPGKAPETRLVAQQPFEF